MPDHAPLNLRPAVWDSTTLRDPHRVPNKAARVEAMFDAIAPTYEFVNTVASLGRDATWRRRAVAAAQVQPTDVVLDVACGTGDMIRAFARHDAAPRLILGADFSANMLAGGRYDGLRVPVHLMRADALRLPLRDACVDVVSCAFGVRNFQNPQAGLAEMRRVLRLGGRAVILEFATPANALLRGVYQFYCDRVLPRLGGWLSRDRSGAYRYLPESVKTFETRESMTRRLEDAGFADVRVTSLNLGGVALYRARVN